MKLTGKVANDGFRAVSGSHYITGHHKIPRIWVVVADRHIVRVFRKPNGHLEQIGEATPSDIGKLKGTPNKSLGRIISSAGGYIRHRLQPHHTPTEKAEAHFVKDIGAWLEQAVREDAFDRLVLAASPKMLGDLRKNLSDILQARIIAEVDKDLTKMNEKDLREELEKVVWF